MALKPVRHIQFPLVSCPGHSLGDGQSFIHLPIQGSSTQGELRFCCPSWFPGSLHDPVLGLQQSPGHNLESGSYCLPSHRSEADRGPALRTDSPRVTLLELGLWFASKSVLRPRCNLLSLGLGTRLTQGAWSLTFFRSRLVFCANPGLLLKTELHSPSLDALPPVTGLPRPRLSLCSVKGGNLLGKWGGWRGEGWGGHALSKTSSCAFFFKKVFICLFYFFGYPGSSLLRAGFL